MVCWLNLLSVGASTVDLLFELLSLFFNLYVIVHEAVTVRLGEIASEGSIAPVFFCE